MKRGEVHVLIVIIAHDHLLNLTELAHLAPEVLVEGVKVVLQLRRVHLVLGVVGWVLVQVRQQDGLRIGGLDVLARAAVAVPARPNFVVEGAVDLIGFGAEDAGEVVRHGGLALACGCRVWSMSGEAQRSGGGS